MLRYSYEKIGGFVQAFDDLLGISDVQKAQTSVKKAENEFMTTRGKTKEVRRKLDRVPRDDERYLALATEEHKILVEEKGFKSEYENLEALERDQFALLSGAVRDSHERERARAERTKHWSVIGSVVERHLDIGSTVVNYIAEADQELPSRSTGRYVI
ncbi:Coiled-coil domain-containing protein 51 [Desmophyllum pertusum]|uniref:Coiled-coil domain-containing protein 51 n=1 Tax=Desmophyllum pertusum TaxID=174260 RepID=A0A9W9ZXF6_9CNID|nr:Coiled-coil domain-containing protein 51 [Desmophyllum pertusum]